MGKMEDLLPSLKRLLMRHAINYAWKMDLSSLIRGNCWQEKESIEMVIITPKEIQDHKCSGTEKKS